jgi:hypothetical protein
MQRLQHLSLLVMQLAYATLERRVHLAVPAQDLAQAQAQAQRLAVLHQVLPQVAMLQLELSELVELLQLVALLLVLHQQRVQHQVSHPLVAALVAEMAAQEADVSTTQPSLPVLPRMV